jgi:hypothetical protein
MEVFKVELKPEQFRSQTRLERDIVHKEDKMQNTNVNQEKAHLGTVSKALTKLGMSVEMNSKKDMLAVTMDDKFIFVTSTYRPENQPGKKLLVNLRYKSENMNNVPVSTKKLPELMQQLVNSVNKKETTMSNTTDSENTVATNKETKMDTKDKTYFDQVCDQLRKDSKRMPSLLFHDYSISTRTTKDGVEYPVIEVKVKKDGEDKGMLIISTMQEEVKYGGKTEMQDRLCMHLEDWKPYRHNGFWYFKEYVNPMYVGSYVECFMDVDSMGQIHWMYEMMDRTRFFDPKCSYNQHEVKEHKNDKGVITVELDVDMTGTKIPCTLYVCMTGTNKTYVTMELMHDGEQVGYFNGRFPAWITRRKLNRFLRDRDVLSNLSQLL